MSAFQSHVCRLRVPAIVLGIGVTVAGRILLGPLLPEIRVSLSMSSSAAGVALSGFALVVALTHFPAGRVADARSHQLVLVGGLGALTAGGALFATATDTTLFVIGLLVYALGMGLYMPGAIIHLSARFVDRHGLVLGLNSGAAQLGGIAASLLAIIVLANVGWHVAYLLVIEACLVLLTVVHVTRDESYTLGPVPLDARATVTRLLANRERRITILAAATLMVAMDGTLVFLPTFLQEAKSFPASLANNTFALYFVVGLLANPITGRVANRFHPRRTAAIAIGIAVVGVVMLVVGARTTVLFTGAVLFGAGIAGFWPPFNAYLMTVLSEGGRGSEYGAARTIWIAIGSTGPAIVGTVGDVFDYGVSFAVLGTVLCLSIVVLALGNSGEGP